MSPGPPGGRGRCRVGAVRSRRTFADLRRSSARGRAGPLSVRFVEHPEWPGPAVAYAVGRAVGNAVVRNRLRRRLRAVVAERADRLPSGAYLVSSGRGGPALEFEELKRAMSQALERATKSPSAQRPAPLLSRENVP